MNPYNFCLASFPAPGNIELAALAAVVQLMGETAFSYTAGPGNNPFDYVSRQLATKFGVSHPVATRFASMFSDKLGR